MPWTIKELKSRGLAAFKANYWPCVAVAFLAIVVCEGLGGGGNAIFNRVITSASAVDSDIYPRFAIGCFVLFMLAVILLRLLLRNPVQVGCANFFLRLADAPADFNTVAAPFRTWKRVVKTMFLRDLFLSLWAVVPVLLGFVLAAVFFNSVWVPPVDDALGDGLLPTFLLFFVFLIPYFVKLYSYRLVPYLLADDPALSGRAAVTRSRALMDGHKGHAFLLDLSFIGWYILSALTFGILLIFRVVPHVQATNAALYRALSAPPPAPTPPPLP
jgi:uncharacterized membrane protein